MFIKTLRFSLLTFVYIALFFIYKDQVSPYFEYNGYLSQAFTLPKFLIVSIIILIYIFLTFFIKSSFYNLIYNLFLILFVFGQSIFDIFNDTNYIFLYYSIPLIFLFLLDKFDNYYITSTKTIDIDNKYIQIILLICSLFLILPYLNNISNINVQNLLLLDIYETRRGENANNSIILNYLFGSLARVIFPFFLIFYLFKRKYNFAAIIFILIILMFLLNGAVKSVLFGLIACLVFYPFSYKGKNTNFLIFISLGFLASILQFILYETITLADYIRRIFFSPASLFNSYKEYFQNNHTLFTHSRIAKILGINTNEGSLQLWFGENVLNRENLVANVGVFVEGYISFGLIGFIIISALFTIFIYYLRYTNISHRFFGIIFVYLYIINTSFIETMLVTHGLILLIFMAYIIIPKEKSDGKNENFTHSDQL